MNAKELGFPKIGPTSPVKEGKFISWIPGMRVDIADWYLIVWHGGNVRGYLGKGGDPGKMIIHFLAYDASTIEPMWGSESFKKRIDQAHQWGVKHFVAPDFSSWADFPVIVQLNNYYRSCSVTADLIKAGFDVIPNICWSHPSCDDASFSMWQDEPRPFILVDSNHWGRRKIDQQLFRRGLERIRTEFPDSKYLIYVGAKSTAAVAKYYLPNSVMVGTRAMSLNWLSKRTKELCG